jgi:hypothetical protein
MLSIVSAFQTALALARVCLAATAGPPMTRFEFTNHESAHNLIVGMLIFVSDTSSNVRVRAADLNRELWNHN